MPSYESLNPKRTTSGHYGGLFSSATPDPKHIKKYEKNPGGRVIAQRDSKGNVHVYDGRHRRQAAINTGRRLPAKVYGPNEKIPGFSSSSGCAVLGALALTGLGGIGWAAIELISRLA